MPATSRKTPFSSPPVDTDALRLPDRYPPRIASGVWIMPVVLAGTCAWFVLISMVF